jgi:hypothetical protein
MHFPFVIAMLGAPPGIDLRRISFRQKGTHGKARNIPSFMSRLWKKNGINSMSIAIKQGSLPGESIWTIMKKSYHQGPFVIDIEKFGAR